MNGSEHWAVCVPMNMRKELCHLFHNDPTAGHRGIEKTYNKIRINSIRENSNGPVDTVTLRQLRKDGFDPDALNALDNLDEDNTHASADNVGQNAAADQSIEASVPTPQQRVTFLLDPNFDSTLVPASFLTTNISETFPADTVPAVAPTSVSPTAVDPSIRKGRGRPRVYPLPDSTTQPESFVRRQINLSNPSLNKIELVRNQKSSPF